jgi:uncharacterized protein (TIRG00374 family)
MMNFKILIRMLGPVLFLSILIFLIDIDQLKHILRLVRYEYLLLSLCPVPLIIGVRSIRWRRILAVFGMTFSFWDCFRYNFVEIVASVVVSAVAPFIKVFYLCRNGHRFAKASIAVATDKAFDYLLPVLFGIFSCAIIYFQSDPDMGLLWLLLLTGFVYKPFKVFSLRFLPRFIPKRLKQKVSRPGSHLQEYIKQIVLSLDLLTYLLSIVGFLLYFAAVHTLNLGLGINLNFSQIILIMSMTSLITAIPISFLGIGTRDAALIVVFRWFGHSAEEAISLSIALLWLRLAIMLMGSIFWYLDPPPLQALKRQKNG